MQKKLVNIFTYKNFLAAMLFVALFATPLFSAITVDAAASFNNDPLDYATLRSSNFTKFPNSTTNWDTMTDADAGEIVSLTVYYHNTSSENATNVRASISVPTGRDFTISASASLSADNASAVSGQTTINLSSPQTLTYIPGSASWYPNQSLSPVAFPFGQTGDELVTPTGVNLGIIGPGTQANSFATQGSVVARFQVSNISPALPEPTVDLKINNSDGPVNLAQGESVSLSWSSQNAVRCDLFNPIFSGVGTSGVDVYAPGHAFYPNSGPVTYEITCYNADNVGSVDAVTVNPFISPISTTLDITANGVQGPLQLAQNQPFTIDWTSANVSSCNLSIQGVRDLGAVSVSGTNGPISSGSADYPPAGGSYTYIIVCADAQGNAVTDTVVVLAPAAPATPTAPTITASTGSICGGQVSLSWNVVPTASSYKVFRDGVLINTLGSTLFTDTGLTPGSSYSYTVIASNSAGDSASSNTATTTASAVCQQASPTIDITVNGVQGPLTLTPNQAFTLNWVSSNTLQPCSLATLAGENLGGVLTNGTSGPYDVSHQNYPAQGSSQTFVVSCQSSQGQVSDSVTVIRPFSAQPPVAPIITASTSSICGGNTTLSWNAVAGATSYTIFRNGTQVNAVTGPTFTDSGLTPGVVYSYTVQAVNNVGSSAHSNTATATASSACASVPNIPVLTATTGTLCGGTISLSWTGTSDTTFYKISRDGVQIATSTATTYSDINLTPGTVYLYSVVASNSFGDSASSIPASAVASAACATAPNAPILTASTGSVCGGQISLSWNTVTNATSYKIFRGATQIATTTSVSFIDTGLVPGATHSYTVIATNSTGDSIPSNAVSANASASCGGGGPVTPSVTLTANPATITQGQNSTLSWTSINTTSCSAAWTTATSTSGSFVVSPATTTVYSIDCTNGTATSTATTTVVVTPAGGGGTNTPSVTLTANPATITQGQNSTLSWTSSNATSCSAAWTTATSTNGSLIVSPATTTAYSIACTDGSTTATSTATVTVTVPASNGITVSLTPDPATINSGQGSTLTWNSTNATSCSAAWTTATSTSGTALVTPTATTVYSIDCTNGTATSTATTTVTVNTGGNGGGGGGGGGSSSGGGRSGGSRSSTPIVLGTSTSCDYLKDYMRIDWVNDRVEVIKLQVFLRELEGFKNLPITGVFDQATYDSVAIFQERYIGDILTPWGHTSHTGFVYILTKKKVNEIVCQRAFPINAQQATEIADFKSFLESLQNAGVPATEIPATGEPITTDILSENGLDFIANNDGQGNPKDDVTVLGGRNGDVGGVRAAAAAIFAGPQGWDESVNAIVIFITILLALYLAVRALGDALNKKMMLGPTTLKLRKIFFFIIGLVLAVIVSVFLSYFVIVLPLLLLIIALSVYLLYTSFSEKNLETVLVIDEPQSEESVVILGAEKTSETDK